MARPLLVGLSQMESKTMVMSNLRCLKDADDRFREIGISNDLTPKQRSAIKTMIADAKKTMQITARKTRKTFGS